MKFHLEWLKRKFKNHIEPKDLKEYSEAIGRLAYYASRFGTIDTYAKSLYLQSDSARLAELKLHLSLYFLLEQVSEDKHNQIHVPSNPYMQDRRQDLRYMSWLAVLLKKVDKLNEEVGVISWNYDLQIEHALAYYFNLTQPDLQNAIETYDLYPNPTEPLARRSKLPFLVHLNGIAGHYSGDGGSSEALFAKLDRLPAEELVRELFGRYRERRAGFGDAMNKWFTFAWEAEDIAVQARSIAKEMMTQAEILIIIGYSFPSFNRVVDMTLIEAFRSTNTIQNRKRIHIQNPSLSIETFVHHFGNQLGPVLLSEQEIHTQVVPEVPRLRLSLDIDAAQFYLPPELFARPRPDQDAPPLL